MQSGLMLTAKFSFPIFQRNVKIKAKQRNILNIGWRHQAKRITFAILFIFHFLWYGLIVLVFVLDLERKNQ